MYIFISSYKLFFVTFFRLIFQFATLCLIFNCFALLLSLFQILYLFVLIYFTLLYKDT